MGANLPLLFEVSGALRAAGFTCHVFGGFAEEARGFRPPGPHGDIDLLLEAVDFHAFDDGLADCLPASQPFAAKRFAHKRAFVLEGCLVELILVTPTSAGPGPNTRHQAAERTSFRTLFWGDTPFDWLVPLAGPCPFAGRDLSVASPDNLRHYRAHHDLLGPGRWRDPASLLP